MSESIQVALIALFGVVVGSVLTFIPAIFSANQERRKFQKEIFEAKLSMTEDFLRKYNGALLEFPSEESKKVITSIEIFLLESVKLTNDYEILQALKEFYKELHKFNRYARDFLGIEEKMDEIKLDELRASTLESCSKMVLSFNKFRLNGYKPRRKPIRIIVSEWRNHKKVKSTEENQ